MEDVVHESESNGNCMRHISTEHQVGPSVSHTCKTCPKFEYVVPSTGALGHFLQAYVSIFSYIFPSFHKAHLVNPSIPNLAMLTLY